MEERINNVDVICNNVSKRCFGLLNDIVDMETKYKSILNDKEKQTLSEAFGWLKEQAYCDADVRYNMARHLVVCNDQFLKLIEEYAASKGFFLSVTDKCHFNDVIEYFKEYQNNVDANFQSRYEESLFIYHSQTINDLASMFFDEDIEVESSYQYITQGVVKLNRFIHNERKKLGEEILQLVKKVNEKTFAFDDVFLELEKMRELSDKKIVSFLGDNRNAFRYEDISLVNLMRLQRKLGQFVYRKKVNNELLSAIESSRFLECVNFVDIRGDSEVILWKNDLDMDVDMAIFKDSFVAENCSCLDENWYFVLPKERKNLTELEMRQDELSHLLYQFNNIFGAFYTLYNNGYLIGFAFTEK